MKANIRELNTYLKGEYMAIVSYEKFIQKSKDEKLKEQFQSIQQEHKQHAIKIARRIQNLGGKPVDGVGITGKIAVAMSSIQYIGKDDKYFVHEAYKGENKGIQMAEETVKGDLDKHSAELVSDLLNQDRTHLNTLHNLMIH